MRSRTRHSLSPTRHSPELAKYRKLQPLNDAVQPESPEPVLDGLVRTVLSQNTTEANSQKAFVSLKSSFPTWEHVFGAESKDVENAIRCGGLAPTKASCIKNMLRCLLERRGQLCLEYLRDLSVDEAKAELSLFKGIGPKTVACVLMFNLQQDDFPVDTHIFEISKTMGWVPSVADRNKSYLHLNQRIPNELKFDLNCLMFTHGKLCRKCSSKKGNQQGKKGILLENGTLFESLLMDIKPAGLLSELRIRTPKILLRSTKWNKGYGNPKYEALIRSYRVLSGSLRQHTIIRYSSFPFVSNRSPQNPMFPPRHYTTCLLLLFLVLSDLSISQSQSPSAAKRKRMKEKVRNMFYHAYDNYMTYAFPHDELKPLSKTFTNSLSELGNLKLEHLPQDYHGSALTLIESLSSLVIMGNSTEFERAVLWLSENLTFDVDARINLFECNIRVLGGLVSAHLLASDSSKKLFQGAYNNQLLVLAEDLGKRFLPAFNTPTALPYAWINLKYGVMENETTETSTSGCGSLILEMGALSKMTGDPIYESVALRALRKLWSMQSSLKLFGTTLDVATGQWIEYSSGIGAGVDSFYEYLLKAHILFGKEDFWKMFHSAYVAVQKYFRHGSWYHEADMRTGRATYWQLTSLQAFWPGLQASS
ncbi:hypothetical protein ACSQ67_007122 [Phaseolus vulgaris]